MDRIVKPLGQKAYGSIPHVPGSRQDRTDVGLTVQQAAILTTRSRPGDTVVVMEKVDGSNVAVAKLGGEIIPLTRTGYRATESPYYQHHLFATWVAMNLERFDALLREGERVSGEWLAQAHGTIYKLSHEPFLAFDILSGWKRVPFGQLYTRLTEQDFRTPAVLSYGPPVSVEQALKCLGYHGHHGALDDAEGVVWRVEREGRVDFLGKYVRPTKRDGKFMFGEASVTVWNEWPEKELLLGKQ